MVLTHQKMLAELTSTIGIIVQFTKENYQSFFRENETQKRKKKTQTHTSAVCPWMFLACQQEQSMVAMVRARINL